MDDLAGHQGIAKYLEAMHAITGHPLPLWISTHGMEFLWCAKPDEIPWDPHRECFRNAANLVISDPERFVYVEGYGNILMPMEHAWVYDRQLGHMVDTTWRPCWMQRGNAPEYFGVPLASEFLIECLVSTELYGIFSRPENFARIMETPEGVVERLLPLETRPN